MESTAPDLGLLRLLDAAANRCREGLRVIEDIGRFLWNDAALVSETKALRHEATSAVQQLELIIGPIIGARDTERDVGTTLTTAGEASRPDIASLLRANAARVQESLRSLEESSKLIDSQASGQFKQLRYRAYTLEVEALKRQGIIVPLPEEVRHG